MLAVTSRIIYVSVSLRDSVRCSQTDAGLGPIKQLCRDTD